MVQTFMPHGIKIQEAVGTRLLITLDGEKLGFAGSAPIHKADPAQASINSLEYIRSTADLKAKFGLRTRGFEIPEFWNIAQQYNVSEAFFVNVFDPSVHTGESAQYFELGAAAIADLGELLEYSSIAVFDAVTVAPTATAWTDGEIDTSEAAIALVSVKSASGAVTYREGWDYTIDGGVITAIEGGDIDTAEDALVGYAHPDATAKTLTTDYTVTAVDILNPETGEAFAGDYTFKRVSITGVTLADGDAIFVTYTHADPKFVLDSEIVGSISAQGNPSGLQHFKYVRSQQGFDLTQITAARTESDTVATGLETLANVLRCRAHANITPFATVNDAIAGRADTTGRVKNAFTQDDVVTLYSEWFEMAFPDDGTILTPLCWHGAVCQYFATRDYNFGRSISSLPIEGVIAPIATRTLSRSDITADNQILSEQGSYVTAYRDFGTGWVFDGNYNASYPTVNDGSHFACVRNQRDTVLRSVSRFIQSRLDAPLTSVLALSIESEVNAWIEGLTNPNRATGAVLAQPSPGQEQIQYATIDVPENDATARAQGYLYIKLAIPYLTPFNTAIIIETLSFSGLASA